MKIIKRLTLGLAVMGLAVAPILSGCAVDADDDPDTIVTTPGAPSKTEVEVKPPDVNVTPPATTTTTTTGG